MDLQATIRWILRRHRDPDPTSAAPPLGSNSTTTNNSSSSNNSNTIIMDPSRKGASDRSPRPATTGVQPGQKSQHSGSPVEVTRTGARGGPDHLRLPAGMNRSVPESPGWYRKKLPCIGKHWSAPERIALCNVIYRKAYLSKTEVKFAWVVFVCGHWPKTKELLELFLLFLFLLFTIWFISSLKGI